MDVVSSLSQGCTAAAQCGLFTHKSVPVIFEPPCIRGLGKKAEDLVSHLHPDFPHVLCLTEHHLKYLQLEKVHIENYNLGAHYCRQLREKGGVAIFVHNSLRFSNIDIAQHCKEQAIEIRALKLSFGSMNIVC